MGGMTKEGKFFIEPLSESFSRSIRVDKLFYEGKTKYQFVQCFYNKFLGKVLFLDEKIQSAEVDEFIYHEALVHPGLISNPEPRKVLAVGGGEGATIREILKHKTVQDVVMVDIDEELVNLCQKYLPEWSEGAFSDERTRLIFQDARFFVENIKEKFDVIMSDLTEPIEGGPSVRLFTKEFFQKVYDILEKDGVFALQAGSIDPYYHQFYASCAKTLEEVFPIVRPYWTFITSFGMAWGFILASKGEDPAAFPEEIVLERLEERSVEKLEFYHAGLHRGLFCLPLYIKRSLDKADVLTDSKPFIWEL
jgi:spermidine synthase